MCSTLLHFSRKIREFNWRSQQIAKEIGNCQSKNITLGRVLTTFFQIKFLTSACVLEFLNFLENYYIYQGGLSRLQRKEVIAFQISQVFIRFSACAERFVHLWIKHFQKFRQNCYCEPTDATGTDAEIKRMIHMGVTGSLQLYTL